MKKIKNKIISPDGLSVQISYKDGVFKNKNLTDKEKQEIIKKQKREVLLTEGKEIKGFWFNEQRAHQFCSVMNTTISLGRTSFKWKNAKNQIVNISIEQAKKMAAIMLDELAHIYLG